MKRLYEVILLRTVEEGRKIEVAARNLMHARRLALEASAASDEGGEIFDATVVDMGDWCDGMVVGRIKVKSARRAP